MGLCFFFYRRNPRQRSPNRPYCQACQSHLYTRFSQDNCFLNRVILSITQYNCFSCWDKQWYFCTTNNSAEFWVIVLAGEWKRSCNSQFVYSWSNVFTGFLAPRECNGDWLSPNSFLLITCKNASSDVRTSTVSEIAASTPNTADRTEFPLQVSSKQRKILTRGHRTF